jgi:hypothetical protein
MSGTTTAAGGAAHTSPTDAEILETIAGMNTPMTYVIRNVLARKYKGLKTPAVRRRLIALERTGVVKRVPSIYERQICWGVVDQIPAGAPARN